MQMTNIKVHYIMKDYFQYYNKNYIDPVDKSTYSKVVSEINKAVIDGILNDSLEYKFPILGFTLNIRKSKRVPTIKNGKVHNNRPPDWIATKQLWERNPEAKEKKTLIRFINKGTLNYVFRIIINKTGVNFKNKSKYKFRAARPFKRALAARIKDEGKPKFDAFLLYNPKTNT